MEQFCVELISKMKKSIDFGISAKQSYMHVLWHHHFIERSEVSKNVFTREIDLRWQILLKIPNDLPGTSELLHIHFWSLFMCQAFIQKSEKSRKSSKLYQSGKDFPWFTSIKKTNAIVFDV